MLKKLVSKILALALCASTLAALPRPAYASEQEPTPNIIVEPEEPAPPVEPGEQVGCVSEFPLDGNQTIVE